MDDFLPSLDEIFSAPYLIKQFEIKPEDTEQVEKENIQKKKKVKIDQSPKTKETVVVDVHKPDLTVNMAVFVTDKYNGGHVPAIITEHSKTNEYTVKLFDGRIEKLGRKFIFCSEDKEFYSIKTIPLKKIMDAENSLLRPFNRKAIVKLVKEFEEDLIKILTGDIESERDNSFRSGIQRRSSMNNGNAVGPFTLNEYNFLLEYFPDEFIPPVLEKSRNVLEKRFEKTGKSLDHLVRQYAYLVLVPEFTIRHILKIDNSVNSLEEANVKLMTDSKAYDQQTGNFINYLYSKQEMYQYARRERNDNQ